MTAEDPFDLHRFLLAQDRGGVYDEAVAELRRGRKATHWMWFVFPQLAGLGRSATASHFAIRSLDEARAYLAHPVLGPRLRECAAIVAASEVETAEQIFGATDAMKLRSSMTLFQLAADEELFSAVLERYFGGEADPETVGGLG